MAVVESEKREHQVRLEDLSPSTHVRLFSHLARMIFYTWEWALHNSLGLRLFWGGVLCATLSMCLLIAS
jgi:hypothetical protein